jgi:two-component system, chemotaxis family, chemotaxis protein CheY
MEDKKILFVEDSPTMRRIIANSLTKIGFTQVFDAENGLDALEKLKSSDFDMIITDWNMPEMNGQELVEHLRQQDKYKLTPILMITTRGRQDDFMMAIKSGVNGYIVKPFTPDVLKKKMMELI